MTAGPNVHTAALESSEEFHAVKMQLRHSKFRKIAHRGAHTFSTLIQHML